MTIEIGAKNMELTPSLAAYAEEKLGALDRHLEKFELEGKLPLKLRIGRITAHHHKGDVYEASADLALPHAHLHAQEVNEDLRAAIDALHDTLAHEIEKYKAKHS